MKKILCIALALIMLAGCAAAPESEGEREETEQLLETGYYSLENEDGEPAGYLRVQSRQITWYDADGNEITKKNYEFNEEDGTYNVASIRKYFPRGGVSLVECVGRTQGLMLSAGNPLGIKGLEDLTGNVRYVNRQKGSGTRILIDYLCKKERIDPSKISGYDREEFTHTSVAAQIAAGTADAGMGIYSAAKIYDLDFLPICMEQYDLLIPDHAFDTPMVRKLLEVLKSDAFRERLDALGGYQLDRPGTVRERF